MLVDRDGTINEEVDHLDDPDHLALIPGSAAAIRRLREIGLGIVVVTNQAQIGRGLLSEERLAAVHERLTSLLAADGAEVDAILRCPHPPEDGCDCRKPACQAWRSRQRPASGSTRDVPSWWVTTRATSAWAAR